MVRSYRKVKLHLMFGMIALFIYQLLRLTTQKRTRDEAFVQEMDKCAQNRIK